MRPKPCFILALLPFLAAPVGGLAQVTGPALPAPVQPVEPVEFLPNPNLPAASEPAPGEPLLLTPLPESVFPVRVPLLPESSPESRPTFKPALEPDFEILPRNAEFGELQMHLNASFLDRIIQTETYEEGPVRDRILGAEVLGTQWTRARTTLQLVPCQTSALFQVHLHGTTANQTTNYTPQAAILSTGNYHFQISKQVQFDGTVASTWSPAAVLHVDQRYHGAATQLAPLPLLGPLANQAALNVAYRQLPQAARIAADRVTQQVAPQFNAAIDAELAQLNRQLKQEVEPWAAAQGLGDLRLSAATTSEQLLLRLTSAPASQPSSIAPVQTVPASSSPATTIPALHMEPEAARPDLSIVLDESFLNDLLLRLPLAGLKVTDSQLVDMLQNRNWDLESRSPPKLLTFSLSELDPVRVQFQTGALHLQILFEIQPVLGERLPQHRMDLHLKPEIAGDQLRLNLMDFALSQTGESRAPISLPIPQELVAEQIRTQLQQLALPTTLFVPQTFRGKQLTLDLLSTELKPRQWTSHLRGSLTPVDDPTPADEGLFSPDPLEPVPTLAR